MENKKLDSEKSKRALSKIKKAKAAMLKADQLNAAKLKAEKAAAAKSAEKSEAARLKAEKATAARLKAEKPAAVKSSEKLKLPEGHTENQEQAKPELVKSTSENPEHSKAKSEHSKAQPIGVKNATDDIHDLRPSIPRKGKVKVRTAKHRIEKMAAAKLNEARVKAGKAPLVETLKVGILHPRNVHRGRYDLVALVKTDPELKRYVKDNPKGDSTIDFSDASAVLELNRALLAHYYNITSWEIPPGYLCPPIPGRADYIHYAADLLGGTGEIPRGRKVKVLDIGTGASCIYPIIGSQSYGWKFVASDVDSVSLKAARDVVDGNPCLKNNVKLTHQGNRRAVFKGIILEDEMFELSICNPPFHSSLAEVEAANKRKWMNLNTHRYRNGIESKTCDKHNFGGQARELWCQGGEEAFLKEMAKESKDFGHQVLWFTSLVSKSEHVWPLRKQLKQLRVQDIQVIKMSQGQKNSRFVAWTFFTEEERVLWAEKWWDS
jgi:23S rRNA (adenine1618-N6)-methyltransferase